MSVIALSLRSPLISARRVEAQLRTAGKLDRGEISFGPRPQAVRPTPTARSQEVTVLLTDVSGFAALSKRLDPGELTGIVNACFAEIEAAVIGHGGTIDSYVGDSVMALFGVPNPIENAPRRAIQAAIAMRGRLQAIAQAGIIPDTVGIATGIDTGQVVAGEIGGRRKRHFSVVGDAIEIAARLKEEAAPGTILIGAETHRYVGRDFGFSPAVELFGSTKHHHRG